MRGSSGSLGAPMTGRVHDDRTGCFRLAAGRPTLLAASCAAMDGCPPRLSLLAFSNARRRASGTSERAGVSGLNRHGNASSPASPASSQTTGTSERLARDAKSAAGPLAVRRGGEGRSPSRGNSGTAEPGAKWSRLPLASGSGRRLRSASASSHAAGSPDAGAGRHCTPEDLPAGCLVAAEAAGSHLSPALSQTGAA